MSELPDNITRFDLLQVKRDANKLCRCHDPAYIIDPQNRFVYCQHCGGIVEAFDALYKIARNYERFEERIAQMLEERKQIINYQPRRVVIKELERKYCRSGNLIPCCPKCGEPFDLSELTQWTTPEFHEMMKKRLGHE